jgi:hypothetical protein
MQELWDLLPFEDSIESPDEEPTEQILLALSHDAQMGSHVPRQFNSRVLFMANQLSLW